MGVYAKTEALNSGGPEAGQHAGEMVPAPWVKKVIIAGSEICSLRNRLSFAAGVFYNYFLHALDLQHGVLFLGFRWGRGGLRLMSAYLSCSKEKQGR